MFTWDPEKNEARGVVVVVVVYTERGDVIRMISARKAKTYEREEFEAYLGSL